MSSGQFARRKNWVAGDMTASSVDAEIRNLRLILQSIDNGSAVSSSGTSSATTPSIFSFMQWNSYTPTFAGFSSNPAVTARYMQMGKICFYTGVVNSSGTSNATTFTISLPIKSANNGQYSFGVGSGQNNGAALSTPVYIYVPPDSSVMNLFKDWTGAAWTNSGAKYSSWSIFYETV